MRDSPKICTGTWPTLTLGLQPCTRYLVAWGIRRPAETVNIRHGRSLSLCTSGLFHGLVSVLQSERLSLRVSVYGRCCQKFSVSQSVQTPQRQSLVLRSKSQTRPCPAPKISPSSASRLASTPIVERWNSIPNSFRTQGRPRSVSPTRLLSPQAICLPTRDIAARCPCLRALGLICKTVTAARCNPCRRLIWLAALQTRLLLRVCLLKRALMCSCCAFRASADR